MDMSMSSFSRYCKFSDIVVPSYISVSNIWNFLLLLLVKRFYQWSIIINIYNTFLHYYCKPTDVIEVFTLA